MNCGCEALIKAIDNYIEKADDDLADTLEDAGFVDPKDTVKEMSALESCVARTLKNETKYIISATALAVDLEAFAAEVWPGIKLTDNVDEKLYEIFFEEFTTNMPKLVSSYVAKIDNELVVTGISKRTTAWVKSWSKELSQIMKLNSHEEIESILTTCCKEGQSVAEFTQAILDSGIRDEYYKARKVSITEMLTSHSVAAQEAYIQSPAVEEKEWLHTGSYRNAPRENHVDISGQRVLTNETFTLDGMDGCTYYPMYPRDESLPPGERINCHCISQPIVSEDILGLPIEERRQLQAEAIAEDDDEWEKELDEANKAKAGIEIN